MPTLTPTATSVPVPGIDPAIVMPVVAIDFPIYLKVWDQSAGTFTDYTAEANSPAANDAPLLPAVGGTSDRCYIGSDFKFDQLAVNMGTAGAGTYAGTWQYFRVPENDWRPLTLLFDSEDELNDFKVTDHMAAHLDVPADWGAGVIDGQPAFWIRLTVGLGSGYGQPIATQLWVRLSPTSTFMAVNMV